MKLTFLYLATIARSKAEVMERITKGTDFLTAHLGYSEGESVTLTELGEMGFKKVTIAYANGRYSMDYAL